MWNDFLPHDPQLDGIHMIYFALGLFIVTFGYLSLVIKDRLNLSEAYVACFFGVIIGPNANLVTLEFARLVQGPETFVGIDDKERNHLDQRNIEMISSFESLLQK